jgi:hypothetical protein
MIGFVQFTERIGWPRTTTTPPPHPDGVDRRQVFPTAGTLLAVVGTAVMVPTFTLNRSTS